MKCSTIGINLPVDTRIERLDEALQRYEENGFDAVEITLSGFPLILAGKIQPQVIEYLKPVLERHQLIYSAHVGLAMDLRNLEGMERQREVMFACIDVCAELGLNPVNFHYEEQTRSTAREQAYEQNIRDAADYAAERGIRINVENIETERIEPVLAFLKKLNHPNVGMTLDLGHLWLSSRYFGYDFMQAVRDCTPLVRHVHVNDNSGDFEPMRITNYMMYNTLDLGGRFEYGRGDIHIPPFWGNAPLKEAFAELCGAGFDGIWLLEYYNDRFVPWNAQIQERVRTEIEKNG